MLFNSLQFAIFFTIVYSLYLVLDHKWQNRMLLVASYVFYGAWNWRFLSLIIISTAIDYVCGIKIYESNDIKKRKLFLIISICTNLGILGFFKYFNFFATTFQVLLGYFGLSVSPIFLQIILPVGISFYTFQTMSYTIDIYRREMPPTRRFFDFALFVAFFPQLVAGPIERASHLLPQILSPRKLKLDWVYEGAYLILWGLFLKVFVADNLAKIVDQIFAAGPPYNGVKVLFAVYAFAFQIFGDFAGYSNIARGIGRLMGVDIMVNFNLPYFATNPSEFWRRWHISLSTWLRDYLYIPLGGNKKGTINTYRNLGLTMLLGGLWHGASWVFVIWGAYHGILLIVHRLLSPWLKKIPPIKNVFLGRVWLVIRIVFFFHLVCLGWLIFRAHSLSQLNSMLSGLFLNFSFVNGIGLKSIGVKIILFVMLVFILQIFQYIKKDLLVVFTWKPAIQIMLYTTILYLILLLGATGSNEFIYFQF